MKRAVSVSLGSVTRDKSVEIEMFGEKVLIERIGTDGDVDKAIGLYNDLDGKVDCFGVGGIDLSVGTDQRDWPIYAARKLIQGVKQTPVVDGRGLKFTLERQCMAYVDEHIGTDLQPKRAMVNAASDRYGMAVSLVEAGYDMVFGDMLFALGIPLPIRTLKGVQRLLTVIGPIAGRLPIHMIYPTGEKQRSFGTNMMESALVAVAGKGRTLTRDELLVMIRELDLHPHIEQLNT